METFEKQEFADILVMNGETPIVTHGVHFHYYKII